MSNIKKQRKTTKINIFSQIQQGKIFISISLSVTLEILPSSYTIYIPIIDKSEPKTINKHYIIYFIINIKELYYKKSQTIFLKYS